MANRRWTQSHLDDLRKRTNEGETVATIAGAVQRAPDDVRGMMSRLHLRASTGA